MSGSGNMIPTSSTMIRPSTSMHAQFRPISPSPPRNTTRTAPTADPADPAGRFAAVAGFAACAAFAGFAVFPGFAGFGPSAPRTAPPASAAFGAVAPLPRPRRPLAAAFPSPAAWTGRPFERRGRSDSANRLVGRAQPTQSRDDRPSLVVERFGRRDVGEAALPDG